MVTQVIYDEPQAIYISQERVKDALDSLLYASYEHSCSPLENLILVDQLLMKWEFTSGEYTRAYALHFLLTSVIEEELFRHRYACNLPLCGNEGSIREVRAAIIQDSRTSNAELLSWSWLYYRFVRVEFNISVKEFCQLIRVDSRTLRRYQSHAVRRLTQQLNHRELLIRYTSK